MTDLWDEGKEYRKDSYSDGIIEVIGLSDVIHMGQVQVGLDSPLQLGQGTEIEIRSLKANTILPIQIDGEPLEINGSVVITVERKDQVNVLATNSSEEGKILNVLMEGINQKVIDEKQM